MHGTMGCRRLHTCVLSRTVSSSRTRACKPNPTHPSPLLGRDAELWQHTLHTPNSKHSMSSPWPAHCRNTTGCIRYVRVQKVDRSTCLGGVLYGPDSAAHCCCTRLLSPFCSELDERSPQHSLPAVRPTNQNVKPASWDLWRWHSSIQDTSKR